MPVSGRYSAQCRSLTPRSSSLGAQVRAVSERHDSEIDALSAELLVLKTRSEKADSRRAHELKEAKQLRASLHRLQREVRNIKMGLSAHARDCTRGHERLDELVAYSAHLEAKEATLALENPVEQALRHAAPEIQALKLERDRLEDEVARFVMSSNMEEERIRTLSTETVQHAEGLGAPLSAGGALLYGIAEAFDQLDEVGSEFTSARAEADDLERRQHQLTLDVKSAQHSHASALASKSLLECNEARASTQRAVAVKLSRQHAAMVVEAEECVSALQDLRFLREDAELESQQWQRKWDLAAAERLEQVRHLSTSNAHLRTEISELSRMQDVAVSSDAEQMQLRLHVMAQIADARLSSEELQERSVRNAHEQRACHDRFRALRGHRVKLTQSWRVSVEKLRTLQRSRQEQHEESTVLEKRAQHLLVEREEASEQAREAAKRWREYTSIQEASLSALQECERAVDWRIMSRDELQAGLAVETAQATDKLCALQRRQEAEIRELKSLQHESATLRSLLPHGTD